jgi:hypothetical protein
MYDDRYNRRQMRRMRRSYRNPLGGLAVGIFIIALAFAFYFSSSFSGHWFLPILFAGLAFCSLFGSASSGSPQGIYGGLQGFTWLMGLALCFLIGFWPWILLPVGVSIILGALYQPITAGINNTGFVAGPQPNQSPPQYQPGYQQPPQPYQQGYQPPPPQQAPGTYQEGGQQYQYPPQVKQEYEQPQTQYPKEQELPPQQQ